MGTTIYEPSAPRARLDTLSDERLIALVAERDERAFEALALRYRAPLLRYCRRMSVSQAAAEDALQEALLESWISLRAGARVRNPKAWLYRVTHNTAADAARASARERKRIGDEAPNPTSAGIADSERLLDVRAILTEIARLPAMQREAIVRSAVEGIGHEQVASELGVSDSAVRGLVYRARVALRSAVAALTPSPLLSWLARTGSSGGTSERLAAVGAGGGAAGVTGTLIKGSVVAITAGGLLAGAVVVRNDTTHHHRAATSAGSASSSATRGALGERASTSSPVSLTVPSSAHREHPGVPLRAKGRSPERAAAVGAVPEWAHVEPSHQRTVKPTNKSTPQADPTPNSSPPPAATQPSSDNPAAPVAGAASSGSEPNTGTTGSQSSGSGGTTGASGGGTEGSLPIPPEGVGSPPQGSGGSGSGGSGSGSSGSGSSSSGSSGSLVSQAGGVVEHVVQTVGGVVEGLLQHP